MTASGSFEISDTLGHSDQGGIHPKEGAETLALYPPISPLGLEVSKAILLGPGPFTGLRGLCLEALAQGGDRRSLVLMEAVVCLA